MSSDLSPVVVTILGREYRVACPPSEKDGLLEAAAHLDAKMQDMRARGKTQGTENVAVMTALNITHELLYPQQSTEHDTSEMLASAEESEEVSIRLARMQSRIEIAMNEVHQIEL